MKHLAVSLFLLPFAAPALSAQVAWFGAADQWTFYGTYGWAGPGIEQVRAEKNTAIGAVTYKKLLRQVQRASGSYQAPPKVS